MLRRVGREGSLTIHWSIALTVILFVLLLGTAVWRFLYAPESHVEIVIEQDLAKLRDVMDKIESTSNIIGLQHQRDHIDFLNVKNFAGSEVGPLNLAHPERWQGPYLKDNPTVQGQFYQLVRTRKGFFIAPGDGVQLSNGAVIGKNVLLDEHADIPAMLQDPTKLLSAGKRMAVEVPISISLFDELMQEPTLLENIEA